MPRGDGTGPNGMGPMTGRGAGYCAGYDVPGFANPAMGGGFGRGFGRGRGGGGGFGRGRRNMFYATGMPGWQRAAVGLPAYGMGPMPAAQPGAYYGPAAPTPAQQAEALKAQKAGLEDALAAVNEQLAAVEDEAE